MAFCFPVAQLEGTRPALESCIVGLDQLLVGALKVLKQLRTIYGNGSLPSQSMQKLHPVRGGCKRGAVEDLEDSLDLTLYDQRDANIGNKPFSLYEYFVGCFRSTLEIRDVTGLLFDEELSGQSFAHSHLWACGRRNRKPNTCQIGETLQLRMVEPDIYRIHIEVADCLIHEDV